MNSTINTIKLNEIIHYEDLFHTETITSNLVSGQVTKISHWITTDSSHIRYDIQRDQKKYINIDDCPTPSTIQRVDLHYQTLFELNQPVLIEIADVLRTSFIAAIKVYWSDEKPVISYGVTDRMNTTYYGIREEHLVSWNS